MMTKHKRPVATALTALVAAGSIALLGGCERKTPGDEPKPGSAAPGVATPAPPSGTPGVTESEIKIGQSMPYSGPVSAFGNIGRGEAAYFKMVNEHGGVNGRKLTLISLDDAYAPPKAVENVRQLVEGDNVALIFNNVGTATNTAVRKYLNDKHVPQLFIATGADKWADPKNFPWTMGFAPSYRSEAKIDGRFILKAKPSAKLCMLYQNDDFGKDYLTGLKEGLGDQYDKIMVKTASYEVSDPTVDSQLVSLQAAGCDTLFTAATPKVAAQTIRKIYDMGWKPYHIMTNTSISRAAVLAPAGLDRSTGLITAGYIKDITDPALADDPGMNEYRAFAKQYLPGLDTTDGTFVYAFGVSMTLVKVLTQCGNDLSRENIMRQAANLKDVQLPVIAPGILINTSPTDFQPYAQMRMGRFNGNNFEPFGDNISAD